MHVILHTQIERHSFVDSLKLVAFISRVVIYDKQGIYEQPIYE